MTVNPTVANPNADLLLNTTGANGTALLLSAQSNLGVVGTSSNDPLALATNNTTRIFIANDGKVEIRGVRLYLPTAPGAADYFWIMPGGNVEGTNNALGFNAAGSAGQTIWARWPFYFTGALQGKDGAFGNANLILNPNGGN